MTRVVDASAIGAVIFGEDEKLWVESEIDGSDLIAPANLHFELGNIGWKKLRRFPALEGHLLAAWTTWCASNLVATEATNPAATMSLAREHGLTFYDASYLWLAQERGVDLISLDGPLVRAARAVGLHAPSPPR